jgi:hypothetical protein
VAVEKLAHFDFAKTASLQEGLQAIFPSRLDIFYHPIFDFFQKNRLFQQPLLITTYLKVRHFFESGSVRRNIEQRRLDHCWQLHV